METHHTEERVQYTSKSAPPRRRRARSQCGYCGAADQHSRQQCPAGKPGVVCSNCYSRNHFASVCRSPKNHFKSQLDKSRRSDKPVLAHELYHTISDDEDHHQYSLKETDSVLSATSSSEKLITMLSLSVKGDEFTDVTLQMDTAATCNTLPYHMFQQLGNKSQLQRTSSKLVSYSGASIKPLGKISLEHKSTSSYTLLDFQVVDLPNKPALLGLPDSLRLSLVSIDSTRVTSQSHIAEKSPQACHGIAPYVPLTKDTILSQFASTFTGLGNIGKPVSFSMDPNVTPIHAPPHRLPVAKRELVKAKLDEMVRDGKLQKVDGPTEWCSNMTVRELVKPDGEIKVRLCLHPSQTVKKSLIIPKFTVPTLPEVLPQLSGKKCKCFTIMDALDGFTQVQITDDSKDITTMHTPWGRYRWLRLPYGISSAPEEFQMRMQELLDGLCGVGNIADDILIFGLGDT